MNNTIYLLMEGVPLSQPCYYHHTPTGKAVIDKDQAEAWKQSDPEKKSYIKIQIINKWNEK